MLALKQKGGFCMSHIKLNHKRLKKEMFKAEMSSSRLAKRLNVSRQMASYIIRHGGRKYAKQLARIFRLQETDFLMRED